MIIGYIQCFRNFAVNCKNSRANGVQQNFEHLYLNFNIKLENNQKQPIKLCASQNKWLKYKCKQVTIETSYYHISNIILAIKEAESGEKTQSEVKVNQKFNPHTAQSQNQIRRTALISLGIKLSLHCPTLLLRKTRYSG